MLTPDYSSRFKKDLKLMEKRGLKMREIYEVMLSLQNEEPLPPFRRDHTLAGNYIGYRECHIDPDWLLIYKIRSEVNEIYFHRAGTHSDLFR
jgi:mRNA interferase YafQ